MDRRTILKTLPTASVVGIAGCQSDDQDSSISNTPAETDKDSIYYIAPDGDDSNSGSREEPLATIQAGLEKAQPGETVFVTSGEYQESDGAWESTVTVRDGEPDAPITITGPEDAVLYPAEDSAALRIKHSHIHLRGLTINGLLDPQNPDKPESYSNGTLLLTIPPDGEENIEDIVCAPAAIGNSRRSLMLFQRTSHLEIGPLRVMGLAGAGYVLGDEETHVGEIIYLGQPLVEKREGYPWNTIDYTSHVHIHHVDNSAGHPHSELVNAKIGTHDILIEYCTSSGGSQNNDRTPAAEVRFESCDATLRWCDLRNGQNHGVHLWGPMEEPISEQRDPKRISERRGTGHSIYGNIFKDFGDRAMEIAASLSEQEVICGNDISGPAGHAPEETCPESVPQDDGIGHLGGDSPWT